MINKINCEKNPLVNNKLRQTIAIVKWKIYNFMIEREDNKNKQVKMLNMIYLLHIGLLFYLVYSYILMKKMN